jgi:hypothetical protein
LAIEAGAEAEIDFGFLPLMRSPLALLSAVWDSIPAITADFTDFGSARKMESIARSNLIISLLRVIFIAP